VHMHGVHVSRLMHELQCNVPWLQDTGGMWRDGHGGETLIMWMLRRGDAVVCFHLMIVVVDI